VSRATRRAFREMSTGTVVREIDGMWQDEGFAPGPVNENLDGVRRALFQSYLDAVDWTDDAHVTRALRVFETVVRGRDVTYLGEIRALLERDGYRLEDDGRIVAVGVARWRLGALADISDPSAIYAALDRISRAGREDPALAIGSAKELIESTAKVVLRERGLPVDDRADVPQLVRDAQQALRLHPSSATPGPDGSEAVKKILGGVSSIALGVAELRNRGYGTGHGMAQTPTGLRSRHAHLAVTAATAWCQLMLDTLADLDAPWRTSP
jgi:Abortive infection C-terminus